MSQEEHSHKDEQDPVRKLLKQLPSVKASPDFEQRLERRIASGKIQDERQGFLAKTFLAFRPPAFSYSLATLVVLGIISYYTFRHSGITPSQVIPSLHDSEKISMVPPSKNDVLKNAEKDRREEPQGTLSDAVKKEKSDVADEKSMQINRDRVSGNVKFAEPVMSSDQQAAQRASEVQSDMKNEEMKRESFPSPQQEISQSTVSVPKEIQERAEEKKVSLNEADKGAGLQSIQSSPPSNALHGPAQQKMKQITKAQNQLQIYSPPQRRDSTAIKDSLRTDSLRRAHQKLRQMNKKKD